MIGEIETLWNEHAEWSRETFGSDAERGPVGPLKHLKREAQEAIDAPGDIMEFADCLLLVLDATRRAGFSLDSLILAADHKLHVELKTRSYADAGNDEPAFHIKHA